MRQYEMFELIFTGEKPVGNEAVVRLSAAFTMNGKTKEVKGFYAGNNTYKVRFYPQETGEYTWELRTSLALKGTLSGRESCLPGIHGMVKVNGFHFRYEDGGRYLPFGTTIYALVHQEEALINQTMLTLKGAPFNKVRLCVFPKHYDFNKNDPEYFAFEKTDGKIDVSRPCYPFWDAFEKRIQELGEMGIEADLILFHPYDCWGFAELTKEECLTYLEYLTRRLSAYPNIWWSLANEYDLMEHFGEEWWEEFARFIYENDPYGHLLSNHNCFKYWDFSNEHTTHCSIQDVCVGKVPDFQEQYGKPIIFDEVCYEGNVIHSWGNISGFEMVNRFWTAFVQGGYCTHGETFMDENDVLWWAKGGVLHGESPERIAFLRQIMEELPENLQAQKDRMNAMTASQFREMVSNPDILAGLDGLLKALSKLSDAQLEQVKEKSRKIAGHCKEEVYLYYFGRQCTSAAEIELPENGDYDIEVIDVWEMTRKKTMSGVHGKINVKLPGKEGIAVLAKRIKDMNK